MDELQARTIIETICKGIDPLTGYDLRPTDICSSAAVQEALRLLLENCTIPSTDEYYKQLYEDNQKRKATAKADKSSKAAAIEKADKLRKASKRSLRTIPHYDSRPWSDEDDADLLFLSKTYTTAQLESILGRSISAIESRLWHFGYREPSVSKAERKTCRKTCENSGMPWSKADERILVEMFRSGSSNKEICDHFKRSEAAIAARLVKLGIIRDRGAFYRR